MTHKLLIDFSKSDLTISTRARRTIRTTDERFFFEDLFEENNG